MTTSENPQNQKWVNFHVHSDYSPQDALTSIPQIVQAAVDDGSPAATVTDHGTLGGTWKLAAQAQEAGIKACLGEELYVAIGEVDEVDARKEKNWVTDTTEDTGDKTKRYHHLTALAATAEGWQNLVTINNDANINGFWHKPRTDMAFLAEHAKGLVLGTGCLGSPVNFALANGEYDKAREIVGAMRDMVDSPDHLFVEVMEHGIAKEARTRADLLRIAKDMNLRVVATNDSHYAKAEDRTAHDMWLAIDSGKQLSDPNRFRFSGERDANGVAMGYHLRTAEEMHQIFDNIAGCEDAVTNSLAVAELFDDNVLPERRLRLPKFPIPAEFATAWAANPGQFKSVESAYLYERVAKGAIERWGSPLPQNVKEQLRFEFDVIESMDVAGYFLMTEDFLKWAHSQGIRTGPGRGSAAGSAVSYSLDIVGIDPLEYGLLFERFLDVTRVGLPDIDNDIEQAHQKAVIAYLAQRYGQDRVARIGSYGTAKTKSSIKDVSRILGHYDIGEKLSKAVGGADVSFADLLDPDKSIGEDFRGLMEADPTAKKIVETALPFDGTHTRPGIHACGVLVSPEPLNTMVPLRKDVKTGAMVTEWNDKDVEDFGLTKVDILGLRNLDTITATTEQMRRSGIDVPDLDYTSIPMDPATDERAAKAWALIGEGRTAGLFQLEGSGMTKLAMQVQPTNMEDLSALVALFRPGPLGEGMHERYAARKHGLEPISYDYLTTNPAEQEVIASVLAPTFGTIVYQESIMALSGLVAGFGPGNKNRLRKAFSKKKKEEMDALYAEFMAGAVVATEDGPDSTASIAFSQTTADNLWRTFDASAAYLFNKCVSGDTELVTGRGVGPNAEKWTVERLFFRLYGNDDADPALCPFCEERPRPKQVAMCARCASWQTKFRDSRGFHLLAHGSADGRIRPQRVADVHHNGTREVFTVTTGSGREITMTANHRMLTPAGYRRCDELSVGDELLSHEGFEPHGQGHLVGVDTIVSIAPAGECATYDVEMAEGTDHNFVANGLISHNSHSVSYGFVSYVTAFLKANWPEHFAAGLLSVTDSDEKRLGVLAGLRADGITLLGPDVNVGPEATGVDDDGNIRLGLSEVKGVGVNAAAIVAEREAGGPFNSLSDLVNRVKVTTAKPSEDKTEVRSVSTNVCHGCAGLIVTDDTDDDDLATFEACQCQTPSTEPIEGAEPAVRESQLPGGVSVEVKLVKAGQAYKLRRTERQPVLDAEGNPVMAESNLSLGIVEALVESGACDGLGPRRGQVAVLRALRGADGNTNPPVVPDMEWGVVERSTRERTRLGAVVTDHPLKALAPKLKAWSPDIGRGARPVQIHRLPDYGYAVTIGVLAAWNERGYNGGRMVNFTLEGSQATINGVMWDRALSRLKKTGVEPQVGDVVAINASIRTSNRKDAESVLGSDGENLDMDSTGDLSLDSSLDVTTDGGVAAAAVSEADELRLRMSRLELTAYDVVVFGEDTGARVALPKPDPVKVAARKIAEAVIGPVPEPSGESAEAEQTEEPPCDPEDFEPPPDVAESVTEPVTTTEPEVDTVDGWTLCESKTTYDLEVGPDSQFRMTFKDRPRSTSSWQAPMKERHLRPKALRPIQLWLSGQAKPGEVFDQRLTTEGGHVFTFRLSPEVEALAPRDNVS